MNKTSFLLAAALLAAPLAHAHVAPFGPNGTPKPYCDGADRDVHEYGAPGHRELPYLLLLRDGNVMDCDGDLAPRDFDGHSEWTLGGAYLLAWDGDIPLNGSLGCFGEPAHHPVGGPVAVVDNVVATGVRFLVASDWMSLVSDTWCGDGWADDVIECVDACAVPFGPGADGAYHVHVLAEPDAPATAGHVVS